MRWDLVRWLLTGVGAAVVIRRLLEWVDGLL